MRLSHVLLLAVLALSACSSLAFIRTTMERLDVSPEEARNNRRYLSDPMGFSLSLYAGLLNIGGQNYRLILVRPTTELSAA